eukprot:TRINITY_DN6369_c1_g1_i2.p1 TRINITY_DN6369_c1_g1~~TRINITY_DN6369_c1_g1_i2.p1  ORF type:complete len:325 (-),score=75.89 TRINITY_DN6369_c1_g1_i2:7-981(-)
MNQKQKDRSGMGVRMTERMFPCPPLNGFLESNIILQNEPSILVGHVVEPKEGDSILDCCAAPGGKTTHLASLMNNKGIVVALDRSPNRVAELSKTCQTLGAKCVKVAIADATKISWDISQKKLAKKISESSSASAIPQDSTCEDTNLKEPTQLSELCNVFDFPAAEEAYKLKKPLSCKLKDPQFALNTFDKILVDAPCSGIGLRPCLRDDISIHDVLHKHELQQEILGSVWGLLKSGGNLIYSTCTVNLLEGEGVIYWALKNLPGCELEPISLPSCCVAGRGRDHPGRKGDWLSPEQRSMVVRYDPIVDKDNPAFFVAKLKKRF